MSFFDVLWAAFIAALAANLISAIVVYALVLRHQGHSIGFAFTRAGRALLTSGGIAIQVYIGLIFLGAIGYAAKLILLDGALLR